MNRKTWLKIWIIVVIMWMIWFSDWSFAASTSEEDLNVFWIWLNMIISAAAWIWVFFAKLAWTFLTNKWVYWEVLWFDSLLWKFRNIMKNFANFWLWFFFVYTILKWLIKQWKESIANTKKLKDIILWLLIAWVGIQSSRFITATVIDISTITLVAAWSFPAQIISESSYAEESMKQSLKSSFGSGCKVLSLFSEYAKASNFLEVKNCELDGGSLNEKQLLDTILPNQEDISWPLYFIWFSILSSYRLPSIDTSSVKWIKATILNTIIEWWTTAVFALEMIILCIVALIRIIYLWMFIVLSPIAILLWCIEKSWEKVFSEKWFISSLWKQIKLKSFFINAFKPTIIVLWLWVSLIFILLMHKVVLDYSGKNLDLWWVTVTSSKDAQSSIKGSEWDQTYTTSIDNNLLKFVSVNMWKTLLELVLSIITVLIVYYIVKIAINIWDWKDFMSEHVSWITNWVGKLLWSMPVIPVPTYDKNWVPKRWNISVNSIKTISWSGMASLTNKINTINSEQQEAVNKLWWIWDNEKSLTPTQQNSISAAWSTSTWIGILNAKKIEINKIKTEEWRWMTLNPQTASNDGFWINQFTNWLNTVDINALSGEKERGWQRMVNDRRNLSNKKEERSLENLFNKTTDHVKEYAKYFWLGDNISSWADLKDADISQWTPS